MKAKSDISSSRFPHAPLSWQTLFLMHSMASFLGCGQDRSHLTWPPRPTYFMLHNFSWATLKAACVGGLSSWPVYALKKWIAAAVEAVNARDIDWCVD
jgi:hypothetical protein